MKRTTGEINERKIVIGMIVDSDYLKRLMSICIPSEYLESQAAIVIARWVERYYRDYKKVPGKNIEGIFHDHLSTLRLNPEIIDEIENDILPGLSDEYMEDGEKTNPYLFDMTLHYMRERQAEKYTQEQQVLLDKGYLDKFYERAATFTPLIDKSNEAEEFTAADLINMDEKDLKIDWLIEDLLPKGLTVFGGKSKTGKSYLMLTMMLKLAQNKWMFADESGEGYKGETGNILYLSLEDTKERLKNRIESIEPKPSMGHLNRRLDMRLNWPKLHAGGLQKLEEWIKSKPKPKLIVIDTMARVWNKSPKIGGGGLYAEEYNIYAPIAELAHKHNISIVCITHTTKGKQSDRFDEILGGAGTQGPADNLMLLSRTEDDRRQLSIRGKDMDELHLLFDVLNDGAGWYCEGLRSEVFDSPQRQEIYDYIELMGKPLSYSEIQQAARDKWINVSPNSINTLLAKMIKNEKLIKTRDGKYDIPGRLRSIVNEGIGKKLKRTKPPKETI